MRLLTLLTVLLLTYWSSAYVYERCELANELYYTYGVKRNQLGDLICWIKFESNFDTAAYNETDWGTADYGLFQINDYYWCYDAIAPTYNDCNVNCSAFLDDDIADDLACSEIIYDRHGFTVFGDVWNKYCRDVDTECYVSDCGLPPA